MTGIEELRKAVNVFNATRESAIDSYTAEQLILIYRAYKRSEWDITPDAWTQEELAAALRGEGRGAESDDPRRGDTALIITVDYEHNCEEWWDAARELAKSTRNPDWTRLMNLLTGDETKVSISDAETFIEIAATIPGWDEGPVMVQW